MTKYVALTHAPNDAARAAEIAVALAAYGYDVEVSPTRRDALIVLWSAAGARMPALRAAARRAHKRGAVVIVRLDATKAPASLGGARALKLPRGAGAETFWRCALEGAAPAARGTQTQSTAPGSRLSGVGAALVMSFAVGVALYVSDAAFAARVDTLAGVAQAHAAGLVDALKARTARDG